MSVVPMKMLTITGASTLIDDVICTCLVNEPFHPVEASRISGNSIRPFAWTNPWMDLLSISETLLESLDIPREFRDFRSTSPSMDSSKTYLELLSESIKALSTQKTALQDRIQTNSQDIRDLEKFTQLPSSLEDIYHLHHIHLRFGRIPRQSYDTLDIRLSGQDAILVYPTQLDPDFAYLVYVTPRNHTSKADSFMASLGFERMQLTSHALGTPEETAHQLELDTQNCQQELTRLESEYNMLIEQARTPLLTTYSYIRFMYEAGEVKKYAVYTDDTSFMICGWVPAKDLPHIENRFSAFPDVVLSAESPDAKKGDMPPVLLKNPLLGRLFQPFTEMYGLPAYNEFDPTLLMAITYSVLFGIMYGDVGQGLVLIGLGCFLYKKKGMWLGGILGSVGIFSVIFGFVFGSFFGYEELIPGFHVLDSGDNATRILLVSAVIGVFTIVAMMVINIINGIRQKDLKKILLTNNSLAGLIFYIAVVAGAVITILTGITVFTVAYTIVFIVLPILVMFCQEPLSKLIEHSPDWRPDSIGGFIAENFFEIFEVILSFVTNTVSFLRVGAYAICHAGMMLVVYTLAGEPASIPVLVFGNILVMGIEGLMVCIQVLRLEFYEMFGRFYESGGKKFNPCVVDCTKKIDL